MQRTRTTRQMLADPFQEFERVAVRAASDRTADGPARPDVRKHGLNGDGCGLGRGHSLARGESAGAQDLSRRKPPAAERSIEGQASPQWAGSDTRATLSAQADFPIAGGAVAAESAELRW